MLLTATGAIATGLSPAVRRCIDGTFAAGGGTVTEDTGTGGYKYAMSQADTNGNDISFFFSVATAIPVCVNIVTTVTDPTSAAFGITDIANIKVQTDKMTFTTPNKIDATVAGAVGSVTAPVTVGTNNDKTGYSLTSGERTSVADAILDRDMTVGTDSGSPTVRTVRQALRFLRNKWSISGSTLTVTKEDDTTASWTSALTTTAGADPITGFDPAG